jgi:hypothetical protein
LGLPAGAPCACAGVQRLRPNTLVAAQEAAPNIDFAAAK